jgi:hypothetical protein
MTAVAEQQSAARQQKLEAEEFLRRVQRERPDLIKYGWQGIINCTVDAMKQLGIYSDDLNQSKFWAGLQHACDSGVLPKAPVQPVVPAQPTAEELAEQAEQTRLAEIGRNKEQAEFMLRSEQSNPSRNSYEGSPSLLDGAKKTMNKIAEARARAESETMRVYNANGTINHSKSEELQKIFAHDKATGAVLWQETWALRKIAASRAEQASKNIQNNRFN